MNVSSSGWKFVKSGAAFCRQASDEPAYQVPWRSMHDFSFLPNLVTGGHFELYDNFF